MLALDIATDRHLARDPSERNVGLHALQFMQCGGGDITFSRHAGCRGEHTMAAHEIAALADGGAREPHCLAIIAPDEFRIRGNTAKNCREWIARAQAQGTLSRRDRLRHPPAIGQRQAVIALRQ